MNLIGVFILNSEICIFLRNSFGQGTYKMRSVGLSRKWRGISPLMARSSFILFIKFDCRKEKIKHIC